MQKVKRNVLLSRAEKLLSDGTVSAVLGWKRGEFDYDVTPALFDSAEEMAEGFVWNGFCGANLSKYLVSKTKMAKGRILVFLKPCDTYSFNQLLTEHRFDREKVYAVGVDCEGMIDITRIKRLCGEGIAKIELSDAVKVTTLYDDEPCVLPLDGVLLEKCESCKSKKHVAYDELLGEGGEILSSKRFDEVERLEKMSPEERFAFWQGELSRCIRCNACRDACPACTCEVCVFNNPASGVENKAPVNEFEEKMFHLIRALHVAGRCTDCGECSRVCPQGIPLHLINRKLIKDMNESFGDYQAGETVGGVSPLTDYTLEDPEPADVLGRRDSNV